MGANWPVTMDVILPSTESTSPFGGPPWGKIWSTSSRDALSVNTKLHNSQHHFRLCHALYQKSPTNIFMLTWWAPKSPIGPTSTSWGSPMNSPRLGYWLSFAFWTRNNSIRTKANIATTRFWLFSGIGRLEVVVTNLRSLVGYMVWFSLSIWVLAWGWYAAVVVY